MIRVLENRCSGNFASNGNLEITCIKSLKTS